MEKITAMFDTLISVDRGNAAKHRDDKFAKAHSVTQRMVGLRNDIMILSLPGTTAQLTQRTTLPVGGRGAEFNFYEKRSGLRGYDTMPRDVLPRLNLVHRNILLMR